MGDVLVYHNPRCSKSRGALEILAERGIETDVVEYLAAPPDRAALEHMIDAISDPPSALVRHDDRFRELGLDPAGCEDRDQVVALLLRHPELLQRPVILRGDRGVIARPSERVLELIPDPGAS
ncbi:MAG TPA: arsenate reductase (glutaredoxin) [Acidimicrobiia bacterium]|nr:arsenate reductase (glutaredoxin) [Acidimicrobiia bacterium]